MKTNVSSRIQTKHLTQPSKTWGLTELSARALLPWAEEIFPEELEVLKVALHSHYYNIFYYLSFIIYTDFFQLLVYGSELHG